MSQQWVDSRPDPFKTHPETSPITSSSRILLGPYHSTTSSIASKTLPLSSPPTHIHWNAQLSPVPPPPTSPPLCMGVRLKRGSNNWGVHGELSVSLDRLLERLEDLVALSSFYRTKLKNKERTAFRYKFSSWLKIRISKCPLEASMPLLKLILTLYK